jgi:hypothetical protein
MISAVNSMFGGVHVSSSRESSLNSRLGFVESVDP